MNLIVHPLLDKAFSIHPQKTIDAFISLIPNSGDLQNTQIT